LVLPIDELGKYWSLQTRYFAYRWGILKGLGLEGAKGDEKIITWKNSNDKSIRKLGSISEDVVETISCGHPQSSLKLEKGLLAPVPISLYN
jgi:hypothetical protein